MSPEEQKQLAREEARTVRRHLAKGEGVGAALQFAVHLMRLFDCLKVSGPVSAYWPIQTELDVRPAMHELERHGVDLALPFVAAKAAPLVFRAWGEGDPLVESAYDIPVPETRAPIVVPTLVIVPLLAYDRLGYRLGYGGGYYDRTLAVLRHAGDVVAVGAAFAGQLVEAVPKDETDEVLDFIVTEHGVWDPNRSTQQSDEEGFL